MTSHFEYDVYFRCGLTYGKVMPEKIFVTVKSPDSTEFKEKALEIVSEYKNVGFLMLVDLPG